MVWRYGGQGTIRKIWPGSMQRRRTTDACAMTVALLTKSSRTKKNRKKKTKQKLKIKKKNGLEIWWIGTCPQNLALIHLVGSEKTISTDDGRPRDDSSSTVQ